MNEDHRAKLRAFIEAVKQDASGDAEIVKQCVADLNAAERQSERNQVDPRLEYIRQIGELNLAERRGIVEYGLQTLKWLFLLNAGALALVAAYVSGVGKSGSISSVGPMLKAMWPFVAGCVFVTLA